jgi:hypothetical protein
MGKVLNSTAEAWCDDLLLRLRMRDVPGARIGEVLAEVQSHVAETGEDPREAFGPPREYADTIAAALGVPPSRGWRDAGRGLTWQDLATAAVIAVAAFALSDGLWSLGAGETSLFGLPAWAMCAVAALLLGSCVARVVLASRRAGDAVVDPRTGADMVPLSRRQVAVLAGLPILFVVAALIGGIVSR